MLDTHGARLNFGRHRGELFTRVPVSYLRWMVNSTTLPGSNPQMVELAKAEIQRRGSKLPEIELSGHAIDNASIRVRKIWHETKRDQNEGIYTWLERVTLEALDHGERLENGKIKYQGMKFVIEQGEEFPVLKTIMRVKSKNGGDTRKKQ